MRKLFITSILFFSISGHTSELSPSVFLNKISHRLAGQAPTPEEYSELAKELMKSKCKTVTCNESYFRKYIQKKMTTEHFYKEAILKVFERFSYRAPVALTLKELIASLNNYDMNNDTTDIMIIYKTFSENLAFDELYTHKKTYQKERGVPFYIPLFEIDASNIPNFAGPKKENITLDFYSKPETIQLDVTDYSSQPNISGLFSTNKFLTRYWNSPDNENRKRAAALFKILICDQMSPALERETQKEREVRIALGITDQKLTEQTIAEIHKNRHANQKDCAVCHTRLDPMAQTMRPHELGVSSLPIKGKLRFQNTMDEIKEINGDNFSDLIQKATKESRYLDCQIGWLSETYLGKDLIVHPDNFSKVLEEAEMNGRRVKNVIESLIMLPEFRGLPSNVEEPQSFLDAKEVLSNCTECHRNFFRARPEQIKTKMTRMTVCLDLPNEGKNAAMPPRSHYWGPNKEEIGKISNWIKAGAPMTTNKPIFSSTEVEKLLDNNNGLRKCRQ